MARQPSVIKSPEDWIGYQIAHPLSGSISVDVTPQLAAALLKRNTFNRKISKRRVAHYADVMKSGGWFDTGEPVIIATDGVLLNGQQRLSAIVEAQVIVPLDIRFGINREAFQAMDTGKSRTAADMLTVVGATNANNLAAAAALLYRWTRGMIQQSVDVYPYRDRVDNAVILAVVRDNPNLVQSVARAVTLYERVPTFVPTVMIVGHFLFSEKSKKATEEFYDLLENGTGVKDEAHPINRLRYAMNRASQNRGPRGMNLSRREQLAMLIKAWNAWRKDESINRLSFNTAKGEAFPVIDGNATVRQVKNKRLKKLIEAPIVRQNGAGEHLTH